MLFEPAVAAPFPVRLEADSPERLSRLRTLPLLPARYPPFDGEWQVRYEVDYPQRLSRWRLVIWKTATVLPHLIVLGFVFVGVVVVVFLAWFAVLFTGRYPGGLHNFVSGW